MAETVLEKTLFLSTVGRIFGRILSRIFGRIFIQLNQDPDFEKGEEQRARSLSEFKRITTAQSG